MFINTYYLVKSMNYLVIIGIIIAILVILFFDNVFIKVNGIIWSKENPDKINRTKVRLFEFENMDPNPPMELVGTITHFSDNLYRINFDEPFMRDGLKENYATIIARHKGYPISRMSKRGILAVSGKFESGHDFIALVAKAIL